MIFPREGVHPRKVVYLLVRLHAREDFWSDAAVSPGNVSILFILFGELPIKLLPGHSFDDGIVGACDVEDYSRLYSSLSAGFW